MRIYVAIFALAIALAIAGCVPQQPAQESYETCGDGVCSAREANLGTCPADCVVPEESMEKDPPQEEMESDAPECIGEGQTVPSVPNAPQCCAGLELIGRKESSVLGIDGICTAKCGNDVCDADTESPKNCPADCAEKFNGQPICDGIGTSKEGWYQNDKLLFYNRCSIGNCTAECRNEGEPGEGWYNTCNSKQIKSGCGE